MTYSDWLGTWAGIAIGLLIAGVLGGWLWLAVPAAVWTGAVCVKWRGALWAEDLFARIDAGKNDGGDQ